MARIIFIVNFTILLSFIAADAGATSSESFATASATPSGSSASAYMFSEGNDDDERSTGKRPVKCKANEEYSKCIQNIGRPVKCSDLGKPVPTTTVKHKACKRGCVCVAGFLKTANGTCVPDTQCYGKLVCEDNEVINSCPKKDTNDYCPESQDDIDYTFQNQDENDCGEPVCICRFNYRRDRDSKKCIPTQECPPFACRGPKEEFNACPPACPTDDCSQATPTGRCPIIGKIGIVVECKPACRCVKGYWRDDDGTCVPYLACPGKCPNNERFSSCIQAECRELECTDKGQPIACPRVREGFCKEGCVCVEGSLRDANGNCVPEDECPPGECPTNERFSTCIQAECRELDCTDKGQPIACPRVKKEFCKQGCVCVEGTLRAPNGTCVPKDECPVVCKENEEFSECIQSVCRELTCSQRGQPLKCLTAGKIDQNLCQPGCVCQTGYLKTPEGICIPENQCYGDLICSDTEVVNTCPNPVVPDRCPTSQEDEKSIELESEPCGTNPVCTCRFNYRRAKNDTCIPTIECPPFECSGQYEEYNPCPPICPTDDCSQATLTGRCPFGRIGIVLPCRPDCRCISGYWRNNGVCVPYAACPGKCPINEEFSNCAQGICRAQDCKERGQPIACPDIDEGSCEKRCVCVEGTLRNVDGTCVPEEQCPDPICGENEVLNTCPVGCDPVDCPKSYEEERTTLAACSALAVCLPTKCTCLPNYRRDKNGKCIFIGECPGICPINEEFSTCTQAVCRAQDCDERGSPVACSAPAEGEEGSCESGCVCVEGAYRNASGTCVPEEQCPDPICGENEIFNTCPGGCDPIDCPESYEEEQARLATCITTFNCLPPKCTCLPNYRRNRNGDCIFIGKCPGICPINEEFTTCTQAVCRAQDCDKRGSPVTCGSSAECEEGSCESGCVCVEGTYRNASGTCVPEEQCQDPICGENEVLNTCPGGCDPVDCPESYEEEQERLANCIAPAVCLPTKCTCLPNYRRDGNGDCIYIGKCPDICPIYEEFSTCTQALCRAQYCDQIGSPIACPAVAEDSCKSGCVCVEGALRNPYGTCVPQEQCPVPVCGENEVLNTCPGGCDPIDCPESYEEEQARLADCIAPAVCLPTKCTCLPNYRRDSNGDCIYIGQCPGICPINEEFTTCTKAVCRAQNCDERGSPVACSAPAEGEEGSCESGCVCVEGTLRNASGICVPEKQCPEPQQCGVNEELRCVFDCPPEKTCKTRGIQYRCLAPTKKCEYKCVCKTDYYRNPIGECVSGKQCDKCDNRDYEFFTCGPECDNECATLGVQNRTNCPILNIKCNPKCYCEDGYARDDTRRCIPVSECPKRPTCKGENENYVICKQTCPPELCVSLVSRFNCTSEPPCQPGCACKSGYFRLNKDSPCKHVCECPQMQNSTQCQKKCE